jgi:hypothetical protein
MDSENVAVIGGIGAIAGAYVNQKVSLPVVGGSGLIPAIFGLAVAGFGYFVLKTDYLSEGLVGAGLGYSASAILS